MTLHPTGELVSAARDGGTGICAFNVITLEHAEAIVAGAEQVGAPVILQLSQNAVAFRRGAAPISAAMAAVAGAAAIPVALHLDHVDDDELLRRSAELGFSSVMYDAGALPYADNVRRTAAAVRWAHETGLWLEAELGFVGGKPDQPASAHAAGVRTDPHEASDYVAATAVDGLAVAVGSSHAMTTRSADLDVDLIAAIRAEVPVPLVLHGSSGVSTDVLRAAVDAGMTKINVGTALNVALTGAVRAELAADHELVDPRRYLRAGRDRMSDVVAELLEAVSPTSD